MKKKLKHKVKGDAEKKKPPQSKKAKTKEKPRQSQFDYPNAGGFFHPTVKQFRFCLYNADLFCTELQKVASCMLMFGFEMKQKVHHDYIHVVNEIRRHYER